MSLRGLRVVAIDAGCYPGPLVTTANARSRRFVSLGQRGGVGRSAKSPRFRIYEVGGTTRGHNMEAP